MQFNFTTVSNEQKNTTETRRTQREKHGEEIVIIFFSVYLRALRVSVVKPCLIYERSPEKRFNAQLFVNNLKLHKFADYKCLIKKS